MGKFIGSVKPISVRFIPGAGKSIEERCRVTMLKSIRDGEVLELLEKGLGCTVA